ncbi:MAG: signal peptidase I, partial [Bacilli bacterium]|nr:signal peptidase I [Bacilli bacterium]
MIDEQNYLEPVVDEEALEIQEEYRKLMKKSMRMIIGFYSMLVVAVGLFILLQQNKFFIFNVNRSFQNVPSPLIAEIFSMFFFAIIIIGLISFLILTTTYIKQRKLVELQIDKDTLESFRRRFSVADVFSVVPIFLVIIMIINGYFFSFAQVDGESMEPTFQNNDAVLIKYVDTYNTDDIVIVDKGDIYIIKRLVAQAGDHLVVNATGVYVNDVYIESVMYMGSDGELHLLAYTPYDIIIPEGSYYVLGDNEYHS